jgi:pSer/pThr/pTyr-binding forkhead associated (FHA) protein
VENRILLSTMPIPRIIVLSEVMRGKTFELTGDSYKIGRTEDNEVCVPDGTISSFHCEIVKDEDGYIAKDQNSTNGTRINGIKITEQRLCNSDILQVGGIEILYDCEDKANTTSITTQTAIDLENSAGTLMAESMSNIDPTKDGSAPGVSNKPKRLFMLIIVILVIVVGVLFFMLYSKLFPNT